MLSTRDILSIVPAPAHGTNPAHGRGGEGRGSVPNHETEACALRQDEEFKSIRGLEADR